MESLKSKTIKAFFWKFSERLGYQAALLVVQIVLARILDPVHFGELAIIVAIVNLLTCLVQGGMSTSLIQSSEIDEEDYSTVFWISCGLSAILFIVLYISAPFISNFYGSQDIEWPLRAMGLLLFIGSFNSVQTAVVVRSLELKKVFKSTLVAVIVSGSIGIIAAIYGFGLWALVLQQVFYQLFACAALGMQISWLPKLIFSFAKAKKHLKFGARILLSSLLNMGYQDLFDLITGRCFDLQSLGYYNQGKKFPRTISKLFESSIQPVMISAVSKVRNQKNKVFEALQNSVSLSTFLLAPLLTWLCIAADHLILVLLTEKWLQASYMLQLACCAYVLWPLLTCNVQIINALGKPDVTLKLALVKCFIGLSFLGLAILQFNTIEAVAISFIATNLFAALVNAYATKIIIGYGFFKQLSDVFVPIVLSALSGLIVYTLLTLMHVQGIIFVLLSLIIISVVYFSLGLIFQIKALGVLKIELMNLKGSK